MGSTGGSNKFFLLDRLIQIGDGLSVHLLQFVLANVPENKKIKFKKCIKIKIINYVKISGTKKSKVGYDHPYLRIKSTYQPDFFISDSQIP